TSCPVFRGKINAPGIRAYRNHRNTHYRLRGFVHWCSVIALANSSVISFLNSSGSSTFASAPNDMTHLFTCHHPEVLISRITDPSGWSVNFWSFAHFRSLMYLAASAENQILTSIGSS